MMKEYETISKFGSNLKDITIDAFALGEQYPEVKVVKKVLRSLPKSFTVKVATIWEAKDTNTMKLSELLGSLQTFELNISQHMEKRARNCFQSQDK